MWLEVRRPWLVMRTPWIERRPDWLERSQVAKVATCRDRVGWVKVTIEPYKEPH
jgi:hypothetical protein